MIHFQPVIISAIIQETPTIRSFVFRHSVHALPGQFIMLTDYENGEKPFSFSAIESDSFTITIRNVGKFTGKLFQKSIGDTLWIRGPYGTPFRPAASGSAILIVGGGCGTAPLRCLLQQLIISGAGHITFINAAKTADELLFQRELQELPVSLITVTDDGSSGIKGTAVSVIPDFLQGNTCDLVYAAGPELMMKSVFDIVRYHSVSSFYLVERYMKCGIGICGQCTLDPAGLRVCIEGPVLSDKILETLEEFGNYTRDAYGGRKYFHSQSSCS